jgi:hypothetical protein
VGAAEPWCWECDDEDEAAGVELLLVRKGIACVREARPSGVVRVLVRSDRAPQARALQAKIAAHYVDAVGEVRRAALDRGERLGRRVLYAAAFFVGIVVTALLARVGAIG